MFSGMGKAAAKCSIAFVSQLSVENGEVLSYGLSKRVEAVQGCRAVKKGGMKFNNTLPQVKVDPESYQVVVDGQLLSCEPAGKLPLSQRFFLF
jgi:urease subunit alpha